MVNTFINSDNEWISIEINKEMRLLSLNPYRPHITFYEFYKHMSKNECHNYMYQQENHAVFSTKYCLLE